MNKKPNTNLMPPELMVTYIKDLIIVKVLIIVAISAVLTLGVKFGADMYVKNINEKTTAVVNETKNSLKAQVEKNESAMEELQVSVDDAETLVKSRQDAINNYEADKEQANNEFIQTNVSNFLDYLIQNKSSNITIIKVEDNKTYEQYKANSSSSSSTSNNSSADSTKSATDASDKVFDSNKTSSQTAQAAQNSTRTQEVQQEQKTNEYLKYSDNNGDYYLVIQGFAPDKTKLSEFLTVIDQYEEVKEYNILGVEKVDISDYSINLFEVIVRLK